MSKANRGLRYLLSAIHRPPERARLRGVPGVGMIGP